MKYHFVGSGELCVSSYPQFSEMAFRILLPLPLHFSASVVFQL